MLLRRSLIVLLFLPFVSTDISRAIELLDKLQRTGEVPPQKLQALQRVLQSEFCNAVREVSHLSFLHTRLQLVKCPCEYYKCNVYKPMFFLKNCFILKSNIFHLGYIKCLFRCMNMCMKRWTSTAVLRSGPMPQPR